MVLQRRHLPDNKVLQTFEAAARHGNFTRAAEDLSLTQSAVSRQIRELEEQLGYALFERLPGHVALTRAGAQFLPEVQRLLALAETTMRHATAVQEGETILSINAMPTFSARWLLPRLARYGVDHPGVRFEVTTRREVFDLDAHSCDLAIHYGNPVWPGATCTYLCSEVLVPVCGGALAQRAVSSPQDLVDAPKIHLTERPSLWQDWFDRQGLVADRSSGGHWFDQFSLTIEAVRAGMGFALLPLYLIEDELRRGELRRALDAPQSTDKAYYIVVPEGRSADVSSFCDWLVGEVHFRPLAQGR